MSQFRTKKDKNLLDRFEVRMNMGLKARAGLRLTP